LAGGFYVTFSLAMPVLVVDDSRTMARLARNLLMLIGFNEVDDVYDGTTALARLQGRQYGLVLCDWNMQPITGYALLKQIRADPNLQRLPVIMVTAETTRENVIAAREAGANGYIVKPFSGETLKQKVAAILASVSEKI
jgi:two-component system, chemotaxis family, chemotaxis protein CheY